MQSTIVYQTSGCVGTCIIWAPINLKLAETYDGKVP